MKNSVLADSSDIKGTAECATTELRIYQFVQRCRLKGNGDMHLGKELSKSLRWRLDSWTLLFASEKSPRATGPPF